MNEPLPNLRPDADLGPLDEHGQQIWSPAEEETIARLTASPAYRADVAAGLASIARGEGFSTDEMMAELARRRATR